MVVVRHEHGWTENIISFYVDFVNGQYRGALAEIAAVVEQDYRLIVVGNLHDVHSNVPVEQYVIAYPDVPSDCASQVA
jgi:hypothetical protein